MTSNGVLEFRLAPYVTIRDYQLGPFWRTNREEPLAALNGRGERPDLWFRENVFAIVLQ